MVCMGTRLARLSIQVLTIRPFRNGIVIPEKTALTKLGNQEVDDILEGAGFDCVRLLTLIKGDDEYTKKDSPN
jgi:hypothetical protein